MRAAQGDDSMRDGALSRREFVRAGVAAAALVPLSLLGCAGASGLPAPESAGATGWNRVPEILARIRPPSFPARDFPVTAYGAVGDGRSLATDAFRRAVAAAHAAGGGRVVVPAGRFLTGPIHLKSNVELHVGGGSTVAFSTDPAHYLPAVLTRYEGVEIMGYSPLIYALDADNVAVTGTGTLDGQAGPEHWWPWTGAARYGWKQGMPTSRPEINRMRELAEAGVPVERRVFAEGSFLRPQFIQPYRCRNVLVEGVTIVNSPMWEVHPVLCHNVTVRDLKVSTQGPNNDGCNPESCRDVLIEGCLFDTGDDCIAIKSGRNADGRRLATPSENIVIRNCRMKEGHGAVTIGSEISGGARYIFAEKCIMDSPVLDRALRFKTNAMRGGVIEHVYMRDCTVGQVAEAVVHADFHYDEGANGPFTPVLREVHVERVTSGRSEYALYLRALPGAPITGIRLFDCHFRNTEKPSVLEHVRGLELEGVTVNGRPVTAAELAAPAATR